MYLMYVDESGDCGMVNSPSRYFVLAGLVLHELRWQPYLDQIIAFRRRIRSEFGLKLREEIHAAHFITRPGSFVRIKRHNRLAILRAFADELASMPDLNVISVVVDKKGKRPDFDAFEMAWKVLLQRFENTASRRNFHGPVNQDERGLLIADHTDDKRLRALVRKMRRYNPIPSKIIEGSRNIVVTKVIEDPWFRDSEDTYFVQAADVVAFLLYQRLAPNAYMKEKSAQNYFLKLQPILCTAASSSDPLGIVRI